MRWPSGNISYYGKGARFDEEFERIEGVEEEEEYAGTLARIEANQAAIIEGLNRIGFFLKTDWRPVGKPEPGKPVK